MRLRVSGWVVLACLLIGAGSAFAQETTGEIAGRVTDTSEALLPGVAVTVTGPALLRPQTATTSETGTFRFAALPVGTYTVRFELTGFSNLVRENVRLSSGFSAQLNVAMTVSTVEETVTVSSESPVVDTTRTGSTSTFSKEVLESIPTSRDPWVMMEQTPSIVMDRANVGGSQSGQQSGFVVRGAGTTNNVWSLDGVNVTDMSATGATTMYYNFDAFEEIQYNIGGNDVTIATGGMGINLVTKSGGDKVRGSGRYLITDNKFQGDNVNDELRAQGASAGNPIQRNLDYGVEGGGPIMKGRAWFWGSAARTDVKVGVNGFFKKEAGCPTSNAQARELSTEALRACLQTDQTLLKNYTFKLTGRTFGGNRAEWFSDYADKFRNARDASALRPPETVVVQTGPVWTHKLNDQQVFTDRWIGEFQYAFVGGGFALDLPDQSLFGVQRYFEESDSSFRRSHSQQLFDRPLYLIDARTTYFLPSKLGGDHAFKVGYAYRHAPVSSYGHTAGYVEARFRNGSPVSATMFRDSFTAYEQDTHSFYAQDEYQAGRFTARLGMRFERYDDVALASSVDENPIIPDLLPAVQFGGVDSGVVWNNFSPRFGLNYDVFGSGKTIAGVTLSRYWGQPGVGDFNSILNPVGTVSLRYPWTDLNGDQFVTRNELNLTGAPLVTSGNYNPAAPGSPTTINTIDPNLSNEKTDELIVGLQHELFPGVGLTANYIYRKYSDFRWTTDEGVTSAIYNQVTTTPSSCFSGPSVPAPCPSITYFVPSFNTGGRKRTLTNRPDYNREYNGFELALTKRYSKRWYANVSYAYNSAIDHYDSARAYNDPTNIDKLNGYEWANESGGSGVTNVWVNAKWVARATAIYTLPLDFSVSGFLNGRQGYILPYGYTTADRGNGAGTTTVLLQPFGESRLPSFWQFDFKVERPIRFNRFTIRPQFTVFNVANSNVVLGRQRNIGTSTFDSVLQILGPRIIQFGFRTDF